MFQSSVENDVNQREEGLREFGDGYTVFPGQDVTDVIASSGENFIRTGEGLLQKKDQVFATRAGILRFAPPNVFWVVHKDHRYIPRQGDDVIGVVIDSHAENYTVDIGATGSVQLSVLAFDGATNRNRPKYEIGTLIFARLSKVQRDMDSELSCKASGSGPHKDWTTGESLYGEIKGGFVFRVSLSLADELLDPDCPVLAAAAKYVAFEIAVGANGFVWVNASSPDDINRVKKVIMASESTHLDKISTLASDLLGKTR